MQCFKSGAVEIELQALASESKPRVSRLRNVVAFGKAILRNRKIKIEITFPKPQNPNSTCEWVINRSIINGLRSSSHASQARAPLILYSMLIMMVNIDIIIIRVSNPYQWSSSTIMFDMLQKRPRLINDIFGWHGWDQGTLIKLHMSEAQVRHTLVCASLESISWLRPQTWTHHINTILYPHHLVD